MPSFEAACCAFANSREQIAVTTECSPFCIAGMTLVTAIDALERTPHRTLLFVCRAIGVLVRPSGLLPRLYGEAYIRFHRDGAPHGPEHDAVQRPIALNPEAGVLFLVFDENVVVAGF